MVKVKPVQLGKTERMSFSRIDEVIDMPNLIEVQKNSYNWFLKEGLKEVFRDIYTIEDYSGNLVLDFIDYRLDSQPKYTIKECKERDATSVSYTHLWRGRFRQTKRRPAADFLPLRGAFAAFCAGCIQGSRPTFLPQGPRNSQPQALR